MGLLPLVDVNATQDKVRNFLTDDFQRLVVMAGYSMLDVKSPSFSGMPKGGSGNGIEDNMASHIDAPELIGEIVDSINRCPAKYSEILRLAYIDEITDDNIMERLGYGRSHYYRLKMKALLWFADSFEKYHDLHVLVDDKQFT